MNEPKMSKRSFDSIPTFGIEGTNQKSKNVSM